MRMPSPKKTYITTQEVAFMLQISDQQFLTRLPYLQEVEGFPLQMPHQKRPKLFSRKAVERWIDRAEGMTMAEIEEAECLGLTVADVHVMTQARKRA